MIFSLTEQNVLVLIDQDWKTTDFINNHVNQEYTNKNRQDFFLAGIDFEKSLPSSLMLDKTVSRVML